MLHHDLSKKIAVLAGGNGELGRVIVRTRVRCDVDAALHYYRHVDHTRMLRDEL